MAAAQWPGDNLVAENLILAAVVSTMEGPKIPKKFHVVVANTVPLGVV